MGVVEQELREVRLRVGGFDSVCLSEALRENLRDVGRLKVRDLGHIATKQFVKSR